MGRQGAEAEVERVHPGPQVEVGGCGGAENGMASEISKLNLSDTPPPSWPHLQFHQLEPSIPIYGPLGAILI